MTLPYYLVTIAYVLAWVAFFVDGRKPNAAHERKAAIRINIYGKE